MGVKLQLVLGSILLCSLWISSSTSIDINSPKPQEHQTDDKNSNVIEKQPKTEPEINYVNKNTRTNIKTNSETKYDPLDTEPITNNFEKQNEVEKVTSVVGDNAIKKDALSIGREGTGRSIDIEKYISPEFQNNEYTLPVSSDTEKYLDEPFSFKTSTRLGSDLDHTTSKTAPFRKFTEPIQKLEFEYLKNSDHEHHDFGDDHEDDDEQDQENEDHERDHYLDHENEDNIDDITVDKMVERSESVPTNISLGWEMKISKDDTDKNNNLKSFTVLKYKKVDYIKHFNDTKVFLNEPKGDHVSLNTTTIKPLTTTTRKNNLLTKPPMEQNNSYLLSNKIETETIKAINLVTTEVPSTKKTKGDEGSSTKEQISQASQLTVAVTPPSKFNFTEAVTNMSSINERKKVHDDKLEFTIKDNEEEQATTLRISKLTTEITNGNNGRTILKSIKPYQTTTIRSLSSHQATVVATTNENKEPTTVETINPYSTTVADTILSVEPLSSEITTNRNKETTIKIMKPSRETTIVYLPTDQAIPKTTEKLPVVSIGTNEITVQPLSSEFTLISETTTPEDSTYPSTTEFPKEDIYLGTDVTTTTDVEITTEVEVPKTTEMRSFKTKSTMPQVTNSEVNKPSKETASAATDVPPKESPSTVSDTTPGGTTETSTTDYSTSNFSELQAKSTTQSEELTAISEIPLEITTEIVTEATEYLAYTGRVSEIMSDGTTIMPEISTEKEIPSTKFIKTEPVSENKVTSAVTTTTTTSMPTSEAITSEVNFVHVETLGTNQTTFIPETLSPNFNYPIESIDNRNRAVPDVDTTVVEATTVDDSEDTTNTSSTENIVNDDDGSNKGKIAAIVISTVGAICLVILAGLLYIMKRRQGKFNYKQRCRPVSLDDYSVDNMSAYNSVRRKGLDRQSKRSYGNPAFEDPSVPSHPLNFPALARFATIVEDMKAEFEDIPQISARASELPEGCEIKNRYANVIPLPETRVYLKTIEGVPNSDYINANYVTGPKKTRGYYIACQAPKQNTVDDFWRMIWEQQCRVILMITHLFENGVEKCADYLPASEVLDCHRLFGDFQITLKKREAKEKYIISSIQLKNMVSNSWRDITHFWYLGWPEKGIPSEANSLIAFLIEARSYMKASTLDKDSSPNDMRNDSSQNEINPVVVHCSPGTGRTGVVIACDIAIREFEKTRLVDIPKIVYKIRRDRANAVQTKEQYIFIYKVISLYATKLTGGALDSF